MNAFRAWLALFTLALGGYTVAVGMQHGWNLLPVFFGDMLAMGWPGQFNADFTGFLCLSALWVAWRHQFSKGGLALAVVAFFGGMMFLAPYLLWASSRPDTDAVRLLIGTRAA